MTAFLSVHVVIWVIAAGGFVLVTADEPGTMRLPWFAALGLFLGMAAWAVYLLLAR